MTELIGRLDRLDAQLTDTRDSIRAIVNWLFQNYSKSNDMSISIPDHILKFKVMDEPRADADLSSDSISMIDDFQNGPFIDIDDQNQFTDFVDDLMKESKIEDSLIKCKPCSVVLTRIDPFELDQKPSFFEDKCTGDDNLVRSKALKILNGFSYSTWPPGQNITCPFPSCPRVITYIKVDMKSRFKKHLSGLHGFEFPTCTRTLKKIHKLSKYKVTQDLKEKSIKLYHTLYPSYNDKNGIPVVRNLPQIDCPICGLEILAVTSAGHDLLKQRFRGHLKLVHKIIVRGQTKENETIDITTTNPTIAIPTPNHQQIILNPKYAQIVDKNQKSFKNKEYRTKALDILNGFSYSTWPPGQTITCPFPSCPRVITFCQVGMKTRFKRHLMTIHGFKFPTYHTIKSLNKIHQLDKYEVTQDMKEKCTDLYINLYPPYNDKNGLPVVRNLPQIECPTCGLEILAVTSAGHDLLKPRFRRHLKLAHKIITPLGSTCKGQRLEDVQIKLNNTVKKEKKGGRDRKLTLFNKETRRRKYHDLVKTHLCSICGAAFKLPAQLRYHAMIHSDETPYACNLCDRRFKQPQALCNHKRLDHDPDRNEKKVCYKCGDTFTKRGLFGHLRNVHAEERKYSCQVEGCSWKFKSSSHLRNHERNVHKKRKTKKEKT